MGPGTLENLLSDVVFPHHPDLLVGTQNRDDAGVFRISPDTALILTLDFFTPMVDDPYLFGQIAATNAINDVYAMGGIPRLAMNIVCYPECEDMQVLRDILAGGLSKIEEAGALLVGGHTVDDQEPKYGLSVTGIVHPERVISNGGAQAGDVLILTKPIGNGIIATAIKAELASQAAYDDATAWMTTLNRAASEAMQENGVHAATDITGFALMGHLQEMAAAGGVEVELWAENVPVMTEVLDYAAMGLVPGGAYSNRDYLAGKVVYEEEIEASLNDVLFSPETAGGLLIAVEESRAAALQQALQERKVPAALVGRVRTGSVRQAGRIYVRRK